MASEFDAGADLEQEEEDDEEEVAVVIPPVINLLQEEESDEELQSDPPPPTRKRKRLRQSDDRPACVEFRPQPTDCSICFDPCTMQGRHRVAVLKCGHLFGNKCIQRWIKERKSCPNCNVAVRNKDIRLVFSDHVAVVDNSAVQDLRCKYEEEKSRRIQLETELSRVNLQLAMAQTEKEQQVSKWKQRCLDLECQFQQLDSAAMSQRPQWSQRSSNMVCNGATSKKNKPVIITSSGVFKPQFHLRLKESRVFDISNSCDLICVGESFGGGIIGTSSSFGVLKVSALDPAHAVQIPCHRSAIRDLRIDKQENLVLTTALDSQLLVSDLNSQSVVAKYSLARPGWSCAFGALDPFAVLCGLNDGRIMQYDLRFASGAESAVSKPVRSFASRTGQPVHSIQVMTTARTRELIIGATFGEVAVWELNGSTNADRDVDQHTTTAQADTEMTPSFTQELRNCASMTSCQSRPSTLLFSSRTLTGLTADHAVWELQNANHSDSGESSFLEKKWTFWGHRTPSALCRSVIWSGPTDDSVVVASGDEDTKQICLWDSTKSNATVTDRLNCKLGSESVLDMHHAIPGGGEWKCASSGLLGTLTRQELVVFSHRPEQQESTTA